MFLVGQVSGLFENFNIGIFSDIINVINVKLYIMVLFTELYLFMPPSVTLTIFVGVELLRGTETIFQGHSNAEQF